MAGQVGRIGGAGGQHIADTHRAEGFRGQAARLYGRLGGQHLHHTKRSLTTVPVLKYNHFPAGFRIWIRIVFGSLIRICNRAKIWFLIRFQVNSGASGLKMELWRAVDAQNGGLEVL